MAKTKKGHGNGVIVAIPFKNFLKGEKKQRATFIRTNFFIRTILKEHEAHVCSKFKNKLRTIQRQPKNRVSNFQLN